MAQSRKILIVFGLRFQLVSNPVIIQFQQSAYLQNYQINMINSKQLVVFFVIAQLCLLSSQTNIDFDLDSFKFYLHGGGIYVQPKIKGSGANSAGIAYFSAPADCRQYGKYLQFPGILTRSGTQNFGLKAKYGNQEVSEIYRVNFKGLQLQITPSTSSNWKNFVIENNYRSNTASDADWNNFLKSISKTGGWYTGSDSNYYWFPDGSGSSVSNSFSSGSSSSSSSLSYGSGFENLFRNQNNYESDVRRGIIFGISSTTPSQVALSRSTSDEMKSALDQQVNAARALDDLQNLIAQLTANVNGIAPSIKSLQSDVTRLRSESSSCNNKILELSNDKLRIETALRDLNNQIRNFQSRITEYEPTIKSLTIRRDQLIQARDTIQRSNNPKASSLSQLTSKYNSCTSSITNLKAQFSRAEATIQSNNNNIRNIENNVADSPRQISLANQQLRVIDSTIADLEAKLNDARAQKSRLQGDITNYNNVVRTANNQIASIKSENSKIDAQISSIQSNINRQVVQCSSTQRQIDDIRLEISQGQKDYDDLVKQINVQNSLISQKKSQVQRFSSNSNSLSSQRNLLQNNLTNYQTAVSRQFYICNQASDAVSNAESNLRAAQLRYDTENKFLSDAQSKLGTFTSQKKAADDNVNRLLSDSSRYSTSPSSSTTFVTVRPSGGISGAVSTSSSSSSSSSFSSSSSSSSSGQLSILNNFGSTQVGVLSSYLKNTYGNSGNDFIRTNPSISSAITTMYPLNQVSYEALAGVSPAAIFVTSNNFLSGISSSQIGTSSISSRVLGDFSCSKTTDFSGYGTVTGVQPGYITVLNGQNKVVYLRIGNCTRIQSNVPYDVLSIGDPIVFRGFGNVSPSKTECLAADVSVIASKY